MWNNPLYNSLVNNSRDLLCRMTLIWHAVFFVTLACCVSVVLFLESDSVWAQKIAAFAFAAAFALWHYFLNLRIQSPRSHPFLMLLYVTGATFFTVLLINLYPIFWLMVFLLYAHTFIALTARWAIVASVFISLILTWEMFLAREFTAENLFAALALGVASVGFAALLGWFIDKITDESDARKKLIVELNATRAELAQREREAGVQQERQRLAREIHDTLAQGFTSIVMQLEAAEQALPNDAAAAQKFLDSARQTARHNLEEARRVVADLRPELLERESLPNALQRATERWTHAHRIAVHTNISGAPTALAPELEITLLRAAQEALNNIAKHAHASAVELSLAYLGDVVTLDIQDNGVGMAANGNGAPASSGFGLIAMRERVAQLGGQVTVESAPGEGTTVAVELPIRRQASNGTLDAGASNNGTDSTRTG